MAIFSVVPELLLILIEFPASIALGWFFTCYMCLFNSIIGFLFYLLCVPVLTIGGIILYLYVSSMYFSPSAAL